MNKFNAIAISVMWVASALGVMMGAPADTVFPMTLVGTVAVIALN